MTLFVRGSVIMKSNNNEAYPMACGDSEQRQVEETLRRNQEMSRRLAEELAVIAAIGRVISSSLDIDEVYEPFAMEVRKLIPFDRLTVGLVNLREYTMTITYIFGKTTSGRNQGDSVPLAGSLNEKLMQTRQGILANPSNIEEIADQDPTLVRNFKAGMRSFLSVPLISRDAVIGILNFRSQKANAYSVEDLILAERIGEQIAGAIAAAQLFADLKKTERSLRESEVRFRPLFEQAAVGVAEVDIKTGRFLTVNRRHCELLGMTEAELLATTYPAISHPEDRDLHKEKMALMVAGKIEHYRLDKRYIRKDGAVIWVTISVSPLWKPGETPESTIAVVEDITERKRADQILWMNQEIASRLAKEMGIIAEIGRVIGSSPDIDEVYERFAVEVRKLIPFDRLGVCLRNTYDDTITIAYAFGMEIPGRNRGETFPLAGTLNEMLMRQRTGLLFNTESGKELAARYPTLVENFKAGVRSFLSVPLIARDKAIGVLDFRSKVPNAYTTEDLSLAERIGEQIAGAIAGAQLYTDLKKTERSLRESESRLRALFERAEVGVAEVEIATGRFLTVNRRYCEILGMTEAELLSTTAGDLTHPADRRLHMGKMALLMAGKIPNYRLEKRYIRKDGVIIWVSMTVSSLSKTGGTPKRVIVIAEEITESRRVREENETRAGQLAALHQTSLELTAELNLNTLLHSLVQRALTLIGGAACHCYLYQPESDLLERAASAGSLQYLGKSLRQRGKGIVGRIWEKGTPLLVNDSHSWKWRSAEYKNSPARALVGAPIRRGEEFLGVLDIMAPLPHQYTQADVEMLGMFATQAAIAIRNARLYNRIEQIAVTDELTGLFNRHGFFQLGEREFERALRLKRSLAVLMLDIDHFKNVNDTYGHGTGDQVLRALADCFRKSIRGIDVAGRYGGEEFVLILPETLRPRAVQIAERLRRSVASCSIPTSQVNGDVPGVILKITVSIGVAVLQPDDAKLAVLVNRADQALYQAKHAGRNRVIVWEESAEGKP
jgi:diguanylate cyclase (GGDEF)-like protein/PAS domain S-box-containing protein